MSHQPVSGQYRPAIDGLRAFAVLSVILFHLNNKWLPGGFVGVDVFFVISGFLITSIIQRDCEQDSFSLAKFYQRRIARIFPAFFTVAVAGLIAAYFTYTPQDLASAGANLTATALSVANMKFMMQGNYFEISPDAQPFLHYWSLSVEEQFYMFFPLIFLLLYKFARKHLIPVLTILGIASFILCLLFTRQRPVWAFFLLPTRAYELLAGCILAIYAGQDRPLRHPAIRASLSAFGLLLIGASFFLIKESDHFPGYQALFPVLGTVCVLGPIRGSDSLGEKFLSLAPLVLIGRMSYSLYLWHWPVFSLIDYNMVLASPPVRMAWKIGLSFLAATICFLMIENPSRVFLNQRNNRRIAFAFLALALAVFVPLGIAVRRANYINAETSDVPKGGLLFNESSKKGSLILMGDSNGSMYGRMTKEIADELGYKLRVISVAASDPLPKSEGKPPQLWLDSLKVIQREKPDFLLLACFWTNRLKEDKGRLAIALDELKPHVGCIILFMQPPALPAQATRRSMREGSRPPFMEDPGTRPARLEMNEYVKHFQDRKVRVIDLEPHFSTPDGEIIARDQEGHQLYHDKGHLSGYGAKLAKEDVLRVIAKEMLRSKTSNETQPDKEWGISVNDP